MAEKVRVTKQHKETDTKKDVEEVEPKVPENAENILNELDDLLDEIDSVLEVNAEEFVRNYVQKGGE